MSLKTDIDNIKNLEQGITNNKVSKFAYTDTAYTNNDVNGVQTYNINNEQNIPVADADVLQVNTTITNKGYRAQASSLTRMLVNHFFGRVSYNLNKINDFFLSFLTSFSSYLGQPNGVATLDENGRIPYSQLPESAVEYKGEWNASTNTPTLVDGTGTNGSMYYVSVGGTQNLGSGNITFLEGDRIIYNGEDEVWQRLSGGTVKKVNSVSPDATGNVQLSFSNLEGTVANSQIANDAVTTAKIADANVTTAKIADANVTTAKIADSNVTTTKIADNAVTNAKFGDVLPISKGGTGATTATNASNIFLNALRTGQDIPKDGDYCISQWAGGSELPDTDENKNLYIRRPISTFWTYIQNKISSVLGLTASHYNGNSQTTNAIKVFDLADGKDLDYVREPGQYKIDSGTVKNAPDGITNEFNLEVFYVKSTYVCQRLTKYVTTGVTFVYVRTLKWSTDNLWTEWRRIAYTDSTVEKAKNADTATKATTANTATYVVDSNQKLLDWANNVAGNDYSSVLIKKGTWTSTKGVNLSACGTKVVVGEVGSLLDIITEFKGLYYTTVPTSSKYYMLNVNVNLRFGTTSASENNGYGFYNCTNLTNCQSTATSEDSDTAGCGFFNCSNLTNCSGSGKGIVTGYGFYNCDNLTNCSGSGSDADTGYGFYRCTNLTNCSGSSFSITVSNGFTNCTNLTNCVGIGKGISTGSTRGYGFSNCKNLTNCSGVGNGITVGYGFSNCKGVSKCKASEHCKTAVFYESYASQSANSTYACADTPEGGFNNTTNS